MARGRARPAFRKSKRLGGPIEDTRVRRIKNDNGFNMAMDVSRRKLVVIHVHQGPAPDQGPYSPYILGLARDLRFWRFIFSECTVRTCQAVLEHMEGVQSEELPCILVFYKRKCIRLFKAKPGITVAPTMLGFGRPQQAQALEEFHRDAVRFLKEARGATIPHFRKYIKLGIRHLMRLRIRRPKYPRGYNPIPYFLKGLRIAAYIVPPLFIIPQLIYRDPPPPPTHAELKQQAWDDLPAAVKNRIEMGSREDIRRVNELAEHCSKPIPWQSRKLPIPNSLIPDFSHAPGREHRVQREKDQERRVTHPFRNHLELSRTGRRHMLRGLEGDRDVVCHGPPPYNAPDYWREWAAPPRDGLDP